MSTQQRKSLHGHEPLRIPAGWTGQDRSFVIQLERLLDDLYRRFGRLRMEDLSEELKTLLTQYGADIGTLQTNMGTAQTDIAGLKSRMTTAEGNISAMQSSMSTAQGDISTLQTNYSNLSGELSALYGLTVTQLKGK